MRKCPGKHDYPKISRDTGKKTLDKWVWIAEGPGIAALKFPVLFTWDNVKFRWFLLDSQHNLNITGQFPESNSRILVDVMSPVPKQAAQMQESLVSFPQWNWDRKEAGNNKASRKPWPSSCKREPKVGIPEGLLPKSCSSGGCVCCHWDPRHLFCPLPLETMFASSNHSFQHKVLCRNQYLLCLKQF